MARDRNTRNLGLDNVRFCVRLQRRQRRVATMQQVLRSRVCKRPRDQLLDTKGHCRRWRSTQLCLRRDSSASA